MIDFQPLSMLPTSVVSCEIYKIICGRLEGLRRFAFSYTRRIRWDSGFWSHFNLLLNVPNGKNAKSFDRLSSCAPTSQLKTTMEYKYKPGE